MMTNRLTRSVNTTIKLYLKIRALNLHNGDIIINYYQHIKEHLKSLS